MSVPTSSCDNRPGPALPAWITELLIAETKAVWSPQYGRSLTTDEAVEILLSFGRLLDALQGQTS